MGGSKRWNRWLSAVDRVALSAWNTQISIYAIKVGQSTIEKLNFNNEFEIEENFSKKDNPEYEKKKKKVEDTSVEKLLDIYDVLLAGVESDD